jgi:sodium transport system permease protein
MTSSPPRQGNPPVGLPPRPRFSLARLGRLIGKELRESLRDRRTLLTLAIMPILLYPLLGLVFFLFFRSPFLAKGAETVYRLGFRNKTELELMGPFLLMGEKAMCRDQGFAPASEKDAGEKGQRMRASNQLPRLEAYAFDGADSPRSDVKELVRDGIVEVGLELRREEGWAQPGEDGNVLFDWELFYLDDSSQSQEALRYLQRLISAANGEFLGKRMRMEQRVQRVAKEQRIPPLLLEPKPLTNPNAKRYSLLGSLLPLILILMTMTGAVYPAIDLTAGERERGTLEILMAAPIPRLSVLLAKYVAVLTVALLTALVNLGAMTGTLLVLGGGPFLFHSGFAVILIVIEVLGLLVLFGAFFSAVLLSLTSLTRSFKEAQAYLIPLMLLALTPGLLSLVPGLQLHGINPWIPLLNIVLLARDLLDGTAEPKAAVLVVVITLLYAIGALTLAARVFGRAAVVGG